VDLSYGNHMLCSFYDSRGRVIEARSFGVDGQPCATKDGYAIMRAKYDEQGNLIEQAYFDTEDRPIRMRLVVMQIVPGSTADHTGLVPGDVVWQYGGQDVHELGEFLRRIRSPGTSPRELVIHRNGRSLEFDVPPGRLGVNLAARPESSLQAPATTEPSTPETKPE
jgi:YD repeat-containing protein